jgi:hypothetical protein
MINRLVALRLLIFLMVLYLPFSVVAYEIQNIEKKQNICRFHTNLAENKFRIPKHLLTSISLAESGKWNKLRKEIIAWPWTITSEGQGRFYNTKAEALAKVEALKSRGVKNIDVGCMQVNLYYHGNAFINTSEALDPEKNIAYAASYLKKLFSTSGDWLNAMGNYHSTTPKFNKAYRSRVLALFPRRMHELQNKNILEITPSPAPIDYQRMTKLNTSFRERIKSQSENKTLTTTNIRQLKAWREARTRGEGMELFLAKRRATQRLEQKRKMERLSSSKDSQSFAQLRAKHLKNWRLKKD